MQTQQNVTNPVLMSAMRKLKEELLNSDNIPDWIDRVRNANVMQPLNKWALFGMLYGRNQKLNQDEWYALMEEAGVPTEPSYATPLDSLRDKWDLLQDLEHSTKSSPATQNPLRGVPRTIFIFNMVKHCDMWISDNELNAMADSIGIPAMDSMEKAVFNAIKTPQPAPVRAPSVTH